MSLWKARRKKFRTVGVFQTRKIKPKKPYPYGLLGQDLAECTSHAIPRKYKQNTDRRPVKSKLRIVEYNVEWLHIPGCKFWDAAVAGALDTRPGFGIAWFDANSLSDGTKRANINQPEKAADLTKIETAAKDHLKAIARKLRSIDADIVVLIEVCDCKTLTELIKAMGKKYIYQYAPYLILNRSPQQIGIITKIDPLKAIEIAGDSMPKSIVAKFKMSYRGISRKISLIAFHMKANQDNDRRKAQIIAAIKPHVDADKQGYRIIITGDFNEGNNLEGTDGAAGCLRDDSPTGIEMKLDQLVQAGENTHFVTNAKRTGITTTGKIDDYFFVDDRLAQEVNVRHVVDVRKYAPKDIKFSDHVPVIVEFTAATNGAETEILDYDLPYYMMNRNDIELQYLGYITLVIVIICIIGCALGCVFGWFVGRKSMKTNMKQILDRNDTQW
eukprot:423088_1